MPLPDLSIRPVRLEDDDYARYVALHGAVEPEHPTSKEDVERFLKGRDPKLEHAHFFAEKDGDVLGYARYGQQTDRYHPQTFRVHVRVHPEWRSQGIGGKLYEHVLAELEPLNPLLLLTGADEDRPQAQNFATSRGFVEEARYWESRLDVTTFDAGPYEALLEKVAAGELDISPLSDIMDATPDYKQRMYELDMQLTDDEPAPYERTRPDAEPWIKNYFDDPRITPEAILIARAGDTWVGLSELRPTPKEGVVGNWFTALHHDYRGQGTATAMKVRNILWARAQGYREIRTDNNTLNRPMLNINERLGFVKQPVYIAYKQDVKND